MSVYSFFGQVVYQTHRVVYVYDLWVEFLAHPEFNSDTLFSCNACGRSGYSSKSNRHGAGKSWDGETNCWEQATR